MRIGWKDKKKTDWDVMKNKVVVTTVFFMAVNIIMLCLWGREQIVW